ncbi:helix-turn-helix transcriptional regulator [Enterococcus cecorum]|uniref:helix-turn-helix domain-containing protein n=1 Tax=Enterococcus cecorum TaxID=44008 RepID=UPI000A6CB366|nr:helix-turn-helix transcriptional regulator [Enterococcus cecorum]MCJ0534654.1 helix-turn-helix transcriptional regulator [Enterococcus cecorum]MCJ0556302.1 helix-turn-helix transcriptional regulator [Enterococcus cecorum]MDZ5546677.1 helix-turn-helix transcriptional regulator [Enterococcus cecorum]MDZ5581849.1 helix-turn-helix transcriptional regulator [Enterococcus cecorum]MDZ5592629.1 helix-turn-helix transcriptional regulator [Enterococcus cecorum]
MYNNLAIILAKKRMSLSRLKELTGISRTTLQNIYYLRAENATLKTVNKICEVLDVTLAEFFGEEPR